MDSEPLTLSWMEKLRKECCQGREDVSQNLQRAVGKRALADFANAFNRFFKGNENTLSGPFEGTAYTAPSSPGYTDYMNRFNLVGKWLATAIDENHFWLENTDENGIPKKLQGNLDKALKDARKWLHREHSLGHEIDDFSRKLHKAVFGRDIGSRSSPDPDVFFGEKADIGFKYDETTDAILREQISMGAEDFARKHLEGLAGQFDVKISANYPEENGVTLSRPRIYLSINGSFISNTIYDLNDRHAYTGGTHTAKADTRGLGIYKRFFANYLDTTINLGLERIGIGAGQIGRYAWLRYGYAPKEDSWKTLRTAIKSRLEEYKDRLSDQTISVVKGALASDNPKAAWLIADQREIVGRHPIGFHLLSGDGSWWWGSLDLTDPDSVNRARAYAGYGATETRPEVSAETGQNLSKPVPA